MTETPESMHVEIYEQYQRDPLRKIVVDMMIANGKIVIDNKKPGAKA